MGKIIDDKMLVIRISEGLFLVCGAQIYDTQYCNIFKN